MLNFKRYQPFLNRVLIKRIEPITKTKGGILIPESQAKEVNYGTVITTGPGITFPNGTTRDTQVS